MKPTSPMNYFHVKSISSSHCIVPADLNEFNNFLETHQVRTLLILDEQDTGKPKRFAAFHNHLMIIHDSEGYNVIEDFREAKQRGFPDSQTYYEALRHDYKYFDDWQLVQQAGIGDKLIFDKMKQQGYMEGYSEFNKLRESGTPLPDNYRVENAYHLYKFASDNGFSDYKHFREAYLKGFTEARVYDAAMEKGFKTAADYFAALKMGFTAANDYYQALERNIRDWNDMVRYMELEFMKETGLTHDQRLLISILSKLEHGKKVSINKLYDHFRKEFESYRYADTKKMPEWFAIGIKDKDQLVDFLKKDEQVKKFGDYDKDGEFFEALKLQNRNVVIDGSNVAHNSQGDKTSKPLVENIIKMVNELKQKGFSQILVIADASLKHRFADRDKLKTLEEMCDYKVAPGETAADQFIIKHVKRHRCLFISNDIFRDWKIKDHWVAENIDYYRLSFMINKDTVLLPDIK